MVGKLTSGALAELAGILARAKAAYPLARVVISAGLRPKRGEGGWVVANCPSPAHPSRSPSLTIEFAGAGRFRCWACGAWGDVFDFVGLLHGASYLAAQYELVTGAKLESQADPKYAAEIREVAAAGRRDEIEGAVAPDEVTDAAYGALLDCLTLSARHRDSVLLRGFTDCALARKNFKSLPADLDARVQLCDALAAEGHNLSLIPGFFRIPADSPDARLRGRWCIGDDRLTDRLVGASSRGGTGGLLIPVRNPAGKISRLALYSDVSVRSVLGRPRGTWPPVAVLSTLGHHCTSGGAAGGPRVHYAGPADGGTDPSVLYVVDGALTAEIVARDWNVQVAGLPGLGQCVDEALQKTRKFSAIDVVIDAVDNPHVDGLCREASIRGLHPYYHFWDYRRGGTFNDYLLNGSEGAAAPGARGLG